MDSETKQIDWSKWDSRENCFAKYEHVKSKLIYGEIPEKKPDVSVMIPTYRRADLLKEAIESALNQKTQYSYTISVVDNDGEIDSATDALMKQYCAEHSNILYYRNEENIGMYGNWNRCIELAQAEWLCMLHDDDMLREEYIETLFPIAQSGNYGNYGIVCSRSMVLGDRYGQTDRYDSNRSSAKCQWHLHNVVKFCKTCVCSSLVKLFEKVRGTGEVPATESDLARGLWVGSTIHLERTCSAISCGGYNDEFFPLSDVVYFAKIMKYCGVAYFAQPLYIIRICRNASLRPEVLYGALKSRGEWMEYVQRQMGKSERQCKKVYWEQIITVCNVELKPLGVTFNDIKDWFSIPKKYCSALVQRWIVLKYYLRWGMLLLKRPKPRRKM